MKKAYIGDQIAKRNAELTTLHEFLLKTAKGRREILKTAEYTDVVISERGPIVAVEIGKKHLDLNRAYVLGMSLYGVREMCAQSGKIGRKMRPYDYP